MMKTTTILILVIVLLTWCNFASAQSGTYVLIGDSSFSQAHYNSELLAALNAKGAEGYKVFDHWQQSKEVGNGLETVFLMEHQMAKYEYTLVGDASFSKATYNSQLLAALNAKAQERYRVIGRWQQRQEATPKDEIVYLMERKS